VSRNLKSALRLEPNWQGRIAVAVRNNGNRNRDGLASGLLTIQPIQVRKMFVENPERTSGSYQTRRNICVRENARYQACEVIFVTRDVSSPHATGKLWTRT
jgi:hypothetical protein